MQPVNVGSWTPARFRLHVLHGDITFTTEYVCPDCGSDMAIYQYKEAVNVFGVVCPCNWEVSPYATGGIKQVDETQVYRKANQ